MRERSRKVALAVLVMWPPVVLVVGVLAIRAPVVAEVRALEATKEQLSRGLAEHEAGLRWRRELNARRERARRRADILALYSGPTAAEIEIAP